MPLLVGGAIVLLLVLLSLSGSPGKAGRRNIEHTILGALAVAAVVLVLTRARAPWLAVVVPLLYTAAKRLGWLGGGTSTGRSPQEPDAGRGAARPPIARMTREEAYAVLGLEPGASDERVLAEYRRLMKKVHPDQGGTTYLATRLNEAKDVLLGGTAR